MKHKISVINLIFIFFTLLNCTSVYAYQTIEEENPIIGTWVIESVDRQNCSDNSFEGMVYDTSYGVEFTLVGTIVLSFTESGKITTEKGTYFITGDSLKQCSNENELEYCEVTTFRVSGNSLILRSSEQEEDSGCDVITSFKRK